MSAAPPTAVPPDRFEQHKSRSLTARWVIGGLALGLVLIGVGLFAWLRLSAPPPEDSARYYPPDVAAYLWLSTRPQIGELTDLWEQLAEIDEFQDAVDQLEKSVYDETGIELASAGNWFGGDLSVALMRLDMNADPKFAATFSVRDSEKAVHFLSTWLDYLGERGARFERSTLRGYDVWAREDAIDQYYALADGVLVFSTDQNTFTGILDRITEGGTPGLPTLADEPAFAEARAALDDKRFGSFYVNAAQVIDEALDAGDSVADLGCDLVVDYPDWLMGAALLSDKSLVVEWITQGIADGEGSLAAPATRFEAEHVLPAGTVGYGALGFNPDVGAWRAALDDCVLDGLFASELGLGTGDPLSEESEMTLTDVLDGVFDLFDAMTGVHPERDFLRYLAGDLVVAVIGIDTDNEIPFDGLLALTYRTPDGAALATTAGDIFSSLEIPTSPTGRRW